MQISSNLLSSRLVISAVLFFLSFLLYFQTCGFEFTYDDNVHITKNDYVKSPEVSIRQILSIFAEATYPGDLYRPLVLLSFRINYLLGDGNPLWFHLANIILYGLIVILVFLIIDEYFKDRFISILAAIIYLLQPVHVETVANIYGRTELASTFFGLTALLLYSKAYNRGGKLLILISAASFFLAMISKESAITLLLLAPLYLKFKDQVSFKNLIRPVFPWLVAVLFYLTIRYLILADTFVVKWDDGLFHQENAVFYLPFSERIWPALYILGEYLRLMILPLTLSADYSFPEKYLQYMISSPRGLLWSSVGLFFPLLLFYLRKKSAIFFWGLWTLITFSLTINLFLPIGTFMAERLAFLPSVGIAVLLALFFKSLIIAGEKMRIPVFILMTLYLSFLCWKTVTRIPIWSSDIRLFDQMVKDNLYSSKAASIRGIKYYEIKQYNTAIESFKEAIYRDPGYTAPGKFLAFTYFLAGDYPRSLYWAKKYLDVDPEDKRIRELKDFIESNSSKK